MCLLLYLLVATSISLTSFDVHESSKVFLSATIRRIMVYEVLTVSCGQAGVQLGNAVWRQYFAEHSVLADGKNLDAADDGSFRCFSEKTVDLEPNVIDDIRNDTLSNLFHAEDVVNNFTRGHNVGKEIIDKVNNKTRKLVDNCDYVQGFVLNHNFGGGTGLGALILERMCVNYRKKSKLSFEIYPSSTINNCVVESYNALLAIYWLNSEILSMLDNEAIYGLCQNNLN